MCVDPVKVGMISIQGIAISGSAGYAIKLLSVGVCTNSKYFSIIYSLLDANSARKAVEAADQERRRKTSTLIFREGNVTSTQRCDTSSRDQSDYVTAFSPMVKSIICRVSESDVIFRYKIILNMIGYSLMVQLAGLRPVAPSIGLFLLKR